MAVCQQSAMMLYAKVCNIEMLCGGDLRIVKSIMVY